MLGRAFGMHPLCSVAPVPLSFWYVARGRLEAFHCVWPSQRCEDDDWFTAQRLCTSVLQRKGHANQTASGNTIFTQTALWMQLVWS